jgi:hypothetical protein
MQNTGTWNSDLSLLFMGAFLIPILASILANVILPIFFSILANVHRHSRPLTHRQDVSPDLARLDNSSLDTIQAELKAIKSKLHGVVSHPKPKPKPRKRPKPRLERKPTPQKSRRRKPVINPKDKEIQQEASNALNTLGVKKSKANSIVKNLCKEKAYNSSEELLKDAIVYIG